jgi:signal peptidase II
VRGLQERGIVAALIGGGRHRTLVVTAAVAAVVVVLDQVTTSWAVADLHRRVHLLGPLGLGLEYNSGTAFSLLSGSRSGYWLIPIVVAALVVVGALAWRVRRTLSAVAFGLVVGGALGNLADRLFRGHRGDVVDFVTLSHWPTFNVADACISAGVLIVIATFVRGPRRGARDGVSRHGRASRGEDTGTDSGWTR